MNLSNILNELEKNRPNADLELQTGNPSTYGARLGIKRAATEAVKRLTIDYRNELLTSAVFIVTTGKDRDQFNELASSDVFGCFSSDPTSLFKELTSKIDTKLYGRESTRALFGMVANALWDKAIDLDIAQYDPLSFNEKYNRGVANVEELTDLVKSAFLDQVGSEMVGINAVHSIAQNAIDKKHTGSTTPVILSTSEEKFALDLYQNLKRHRLPDGTYRGLSDKVFLVVAGKGSTNLKGAKDSILVKNVSEETVGEALATVRNKL